MCLDSHGVESSKQCRVMSTDTTNVSWWVDQLPACPRSGIGRAQNVEYRHHQPPTATHDLQDVAFTMMCVQLL